MTLSLDREILYPDSDGQPMADNTKQYRWIVLIKENLELLFTDNPEIFVAGDLLWYAVEGSPQIRLAPDVMVIFGRPKGDRGSYKQWQEENIAPQVVFEILSPGNRLKEMVKKFDFYSRYGVEEYYIYDPNSNELDGMQREDGELKFIEDMDGFTSPRLGIRFVLTQETLEIYRPDGRKFLTTVELEQRAEQERLRAEQASEQAEQERLRAEQASEQAEQERLRAEQASEQAERERLRAEQASEQAEQERLRAERVSEQAERERLRAERVSEQAERERLRAERLAAQLRALGIEPESH